MYKVTATIAATLWLSTYVHIQLILQSIISNSEHGTMNYMHYANEKMTCMCVCVHELMCYWIHDTVDTQLIHTHTYTQSIKSHRQLDWCSLLD